MMARTLLIEKRVVLQFFGFCWFLFKSKDLLDFKDLKSQQIPKSA